MKAVVCREPGRMTLEDRPEPARARGEVLVRIRRVGICGTDYHIYQGHHPFLEYPRLIGHELSGTVAEAPAGSRFAAGQDVIVLPYLSCGRCNACRNRKPNCCTQIAVLGVHRDGGMCEWLSLPEDNLLPADGLSLDEAATVEFLAIGAHAVRRAGPLQGLRVLVTGAGPIGIGTAIFAGIAGAEVVLMDRDANRLALAAAATGLDRSIVADGASQSAVSVATNGDGFDVVFDATGNRTSMETSFGHVAHGGTLVLVGVLQDQIAFSDADFHKREMTLMASRNATLEDFEHVIAAIKAGQVPVEKIVTHRTSLDSVARDLPVWANDRAALIKALVEVEDG